MKDAEVRNAVIRAADRNGALLTLSCGKAHRLAAELGVEVSRIGTVCQTGGIKVVHCQLGCFGDRRLG